MKKTIGWIIGAWLLGPAVETVRPQGPTSLPTIPANVQAEIRKRVDNRYSVAMVAGVLNTNGVSFYSYGSRDIDRDEPVDENTVFEIGSITKTFTTLLLSDMALRGELALTNLLQEFLPAGVQAPKYGGQAIQLAHLASHVSGLPRMPTNFAPANMLNPFADYGDQQMFEFLNTYELPRAPGSLYEYSNYGMGLLGNVLSRFKGIGYEQLVRERVLTVLGLQDTTITLSESQRGRLASGYSGVISIPSWDFEALAGAGAIRSTAKDMLAYLAANMGFTATPLYSAMTNAHQARVTTPTPGLQVGLGWHLLTGGGRQVVFHDGQTGGYAALVAFEPNAQKAVVILASGVEVASDLGFYTLDNALGPFASYPVPQPVPLEILRRYFGRYESTNGDYFLVDVQRNHLTFSYSGDQGSGFTVYPLTTNRFQNPIIPGNVQGTFVYNDLGHVTGMRWTQSGATGLYSKKQLASRLQVQLAGMAVHLNLSGDTGINYVIEASDDLRRWNAISTNTIWDAAVSDTTAARAAHFYRLREP